MYHDYSDSELVQVKNVTSAAELTFTNFSSQSKLVSGFVAVPEIDAVW